MATQTATYNINADSWTLFDKIMYGGLGYGAFCLPSDFLKVIVAIIFPPLGEIINIIEDKISDMFPYINWACIIELFANIQTIIYSFLLSTCFYIPGLLYTLTNIVNKQNNIAFDKKGNKINYADRNIHNYMNSIGNIGNIDINTDAIGSNTKNLTYSIGNNINYATSNAASNSISNINSGVNRGINASSNVASNSISNINSGVNRGINASSNAASDSIGNINSGATSGLNATSNALSDSLDSIGSLF